LVLEKRHFPKLQRPSTREEKVKTALENRSAREKSVKTGLAKLLHLGIPEFLDGRFSPTFFSEPAGLGRKLDFPFARA
jgi:hypothetical protein